MARIWLPALLVFSLVSPPVPGAAAATSDPEVQRGIELVDQGEYDQAIFVLDGAARRLTEAKADPNVIAEAYLHLGIAYLGKGHEAAAKARFREAVTQIRGLTLSPDRFPPKVIDLFEAARAEQLTASAAGAAASPEAPPAEEVTPKKGGKGKIVLIGVAGAAAAGVAVAAGGGGGSETGGSSSTPNLREQRFEGFLQDQEERHFTIVATAAGPMEATLTWEDGQKELQIVCQESDPPYTACGVSNRSANTTSVLRVQVAQKSYLLTINNYNPTSERFVFTVRHP